MNALSRLPVVRMLSPPAGAAPPAPPIGAQPARYGNGAVEIQVYPAATVADRLAAARTLLEGTAWTVALQIEDRR